MYLSRRLGVLERAFHDRGGYMPRDASADPYAHSLAWSRRFDGLKLHLTIEAQGWDGMAASLRRRTALGDRLRDGLRARGWAIVNDTKLPVVCFSDPAVRSLDLVARTVNAGGAWISVTKLSTGTRALRACITHHATTEEHVDALIASLDRARLAA
jgi:glutamate/tyrosine decarboxylase-like PLP-dependent enzyme